MKALPGTAVALAIDWAFAAAYYAALARPRPVRWAVLAAFALPMLATPLAVGPEHTFIRFLLGVQAAFLYFGMLDVNRTVARGGRPDLEAYLLFLAHPLHLVFSRMDEEPGPGRRANLLRLARSAVEISVGVAAIRLAFRYEADLAAAGFWIEHAVKCVAFYPALDGSVVGLVALWRLAGGRAIDVYRDPILATTPADFWRRYNRVVGKFLFENVARPVGGFRRPALATMAAFAFSAALHEYVFGIAIGEVQGYQTVFFLVHGVAVVATQRVDPVGLASRALWTLATLVFNLATLAVFALSLDQTVRWYFH